MFGRPLRAVLDSADRIQNQFGYEYQGGYDQVNGLQTPVSAHNASVKAQALDMDMDALDQSTRGRSSSEEKELTPAQSVGLHLLYACADSG